MDFQASGPFFPRDSTYLTTVVNVEANERVEQVSQKTFLEDPFSVQTSARERGVKLKSTTFAAST